MSVVKGGGVSSRGASAVMLIGQGRETYERALADPESLAEVAEPDVECEDLLYAGSRAWAAVTGQEQPPERATPYPAKPHGTPWTEDELDTHFPRLTAAFGA